MLYHWATIIGQVIPDSEFCICIRSQFGFSLKMLDLMDGNDTFEYCASKMCRKFFQNWKKIFLQNPKEKTNWKILFLERKFVTSNNVGGDQKYFVQSRIFFWENGLLMLWMNASFSSSTDAAQALWHCSTVAPYEGSRLIFKSSANERGSKRL